uniref:E3 ubiquitin-protein ligase TRIM58 n=1 Tax=Varanus komodoensis TaxID=61221 RepID=A0A8D2J236_VARKO
MAFSMDDPVEKLQDEVSCSICLEYLRAPVTIDCGHNFCHACISDHCKQGVATGAALCPQCRAGFLLSNCRPNKQLANIVEGIERLALRPSRAPGEALCERHGKKLRLFCQDDGEPICLVCDKSREHRAHTVLPIEEAAHDYKVRRSRAKETHEKVEERRMLIAYGFERRRRALDEEEQLLLRQLQDEEQAVLKQLQMNLAFMLGQRTGLNELISEMEDKCQQPAASLLKVGLSETASWKVLWACQSCLTLPPRRTLLAIVPSPVTFDPDTANPYLLLSEDLLRVQVGDRKQDLPKSLSRFETCTCLMGREQFTSGRHYWEVCVESKTSWTLGVCQETVSRQGIFTPSPAMGFWTVWLRNGDEYAALTSPLTELVLKEKPGVVGIFLDYDSGEVSFYNADNGSQIFTFANSFSGVLRPYFYPGVQAGGNDAPLIILPVLFIL